MTDSDRVRSFRDNIMAGLVTAVVLAVFLAVWPLINIVLATYVEPYRKVWAAREGKESMVAAYRETTEACDRVSEHPEKYAQDVIAACQRLDVAEVRHTEALVRERASDGTLAIMVARSSGQFDIFHLSAAKVLLEQYVDAAASTLAR